MTLELPGPGSIPLSGWWGNGLVFGRDPAAFVTVEMKVVLPLIVQRYRLGLRSGAKADRQGMVLSAPSKNIPLTIQPQDFAFTVPQQIKGNIHRLLQIDWLNRSTGILEFGRNLYHSNQRLLCRNYLNSR